MVDARTLNKPEFHIHPTPTEFTLHRTGSDMVVTIRRDTGAIQVSQNTAQTQSKGIDCYGVMGILNLIATKYMLVIKEALFIGKLHTSYIYRVEHVEFLPYASTSHLSANINKAKDDAYLSMIQSILETKFFYFSYDFDLTHTLQRISDLSEGAKGLQHWERAEQKFFWNKYMSEELIKAQAHDWILPIINGYVQIECTHFEGNELEYCIISRRDHRRIGTRFNVRGLDKDGNSVNFAETEQILIHTHNNKTTMCSYVQTRGSIPLLWQQKVNLAYMPRARVVGNSQQNLSAAQNHFNECLEVYGDQYLVNLIDSKGNQKMMGDAFSDVVNSLKNDRVQYIWFDFHKECAKMQWGNLSKLVKQVEKSLDEYGSYRLSIDVGGEWGDEVSHERQVGCFRTNCMDCLDRTNVVQSVFARNVLHRQLHQLSILPQPSEDPFAPFPEPLEAVFRDFWVNNANAMSILYSGTDALKKDFTKYGKRTMKGALDDGYNSAVRYILNNFYDGERQDTYDMFLGRIDPFTQKIQPSKGVRPALVALLIVLVVLWFGLEFAVGDGLVYWGAFLLALGVVGKGAKSVGKFFVNKPLIDYQKQMGEEFKALCADNFRKAFIQLSQGWGRSYCSNMNCGSNTQCAKHNPNEAAAYLLNRLNYNEDGSINSSRSDFHFWGDIPKVYATVEEFLDALEAAPDKEQVVCDLFWSNEALGMSFLWEDIGPYGLHKFEPESIKAMYMAIENLVEKGVIQQDWQAMAVERAERDSGLYGARLRVRALLLHLDNPAFVDLDFYTSFQRVMGALTNLTTEERDAAVDLISNYSPEHLKEKVSFVQQYIIVNIWGSSYITIEPICNACETLKLLWEVNQKTSAISHAEFYNDAVNRETSVKEDFIRWNKIMRAKDEGRTLNKKESFVFMNYPFIFDAESKSKLLDIENKAIMNGQLRESFYTHMMGGRLNPFLVLQVSRENIIDDSLTQLVYNEHDLKKPLKVQFIGEEGVDEGGISKEFFQLIIKALFDPHYSMFVYDEEFNYYWFNPNTIETTQNFELVGMVLGLAMYNNVILDVHCPMALYKKLVDTPVGLPDLKAMNPQMHEALMTLIEFDGDVENTYCRYFQVDTEAFGEVFSHELKEGGKEIPVTNENRDEYVRLYTDWYLNKSIERQFEALKFGFLKVAGGSIYRMLNHVELENLICGNPELDFTELEAVTEYENGYEANNPTIVNFWKVVHSLELEMKKKFLFFCTGSDRAPVGGLRNMKFIISRNGPDSDRLLTSHTCFNHILLPEYQTEEKMRRVISIAINNAQGFGLR